MRGSVTDLEMASSQVKIDTESVVLDGILEIPAGATGLVLFVHGSGSSRLSLRNRFVAQELSQGRLATLLFDLLTEKEEEVDQSSGHLRFDIDLLTERLVETTRWALQNPDTKALNVGYFGASTGAAAALRAAAEVPEHVHAIVSRGGRPDLAMPILGQVQAPTLLIVGGQDMQVLALNRQALARLRAEKKLEVVPGATHLFEEPGTLYKVARLARQWFMHHLTIKAAS